MIFCEIFGVWIFSFQQLNLTLRYKLILNTNNFQKILLSTS